MKILVCSDGSPESAEAVAFASLLRSSGGEDAFALLGVQTGAGANRELLDILADQQRRLSRDGHAVELLTGSGEPIGQIEDLAEKERFDLVVLGGRRRARRRLTTFGSSTYRIVRALIPPVLVVPGARQTLRRIVLAMGGIGRIERAVDVAGTIAAGAGARVTVLHVLSQPPVAYAPLVEHDLDPGVVASRSDALSRQLREIGARLSDRGVANDTLFRFGAIPDGIVRAARDLDADLLVVGTSPAGGEVRRYLLGDLTREILDATPCPILFVRTGTSLWRKVYGDFKGTLGIDG